MDTATKPFTQPHQPPHSPPPFLFNFLHIHFLNLYSFPSSPNILEIPLIHPDLIKRLWCCSRKIAYLGRAQGLRTAYIKLKETIDDWKKLPLVKVLNLSKKSRKSLYLQLGARNIQCFFFANVFDVPFHLETDSTYKN